MSAPSHEHALASVIIPAHDEEAVIGRLLDALGEGLDGARLDVVVACNGCSDGTAAVARARGVRVVEIAEASKIAALDAGDAAATTFPRLYVDADVVLTGGAVASVVRTLAAPGVHYASPPGVMDTAGRPWAVRAFFDLWAAVPTGDDSPVGSGVFAFDEAGRGRFGAWPPVVADDLFARVLFAREERRVVPTDPVVVEAPWTVRALVRRRTRVYAGNMEVAAHPELGRLPGLAERRAPWWRAVQAHPRLALEAVPYLAVNTVAKLAARRAVRRAAPLAWGRDETTRRASPAAPTHGTAS
ncbi:MAG TPA: glycosyltransferase family 2 protein [Acidimicrobiales bacterium]|nr:glycosyltransferase family 2 protein [Acidimicrobiales bacterium]